MENNYHDKFPIAEQIEEMTNNQAAARMLLNKAPDNVQEKEVKPTKIMVLLICCFIVLYLVCAMLATLLIREDFRGQYRKNLNAVTEYVVSNLGKTVEDGIPIAAYANSIYELEATKELYQNFSVAIYDEKGELLGSTGTYLCLEIEEGEVYYIPLKEYFKEHQIMQLREYVKFGETKYMNEAKIDSETKTLVSFQIESAPSFGSALVVWEWEHPEADSFKEENLITVYDKTQVRNVVSIPYFRNEDTYERWQEEAFLQKPNDIVDVKAEYPVKTLDTYFSKMKEETVEEISYQNENGEKETYYVSVRTVGHTMKETANFLFFMYVFGLAVMLAGIIITVCSFHKLRVNGK